MFLEENLPSTRPKNRAYPFSSITKIKYWLFHNHSTNTRRERKKVNLVCILIAFPTWTRISTHAKTLSKEGILTGLTLTTFTFFLGTGASGRFGYVSVLGGVGSKSITVRGATTLVSLPLLVVLVLIQYEQGNRMYLVLEYTM